MKKNSMQKYLQSSSGWVVLVLMMLGVQASIAQTVITGHINDDDGPLIGASVVVEGTTAGAVTDFDGKYILQYDGEVNVLKVSYLGYTTQKIEVNGRRSIDVLMSADAEALKEVVVVGYGTQRKADLTGAVASISSSDIASKPFTSPDQALAGTISGVNITNRSGDPGAPISVRIRGVGTPGINDPLWVIDGVPIVQTSNITVNTSSTTESNPLAGLNANDIESIDVLKDAASTAIYGARAANGVIIVTTKKGKSGRARITYDGYLSSASVRDKIDVLDVDQYIDIQNELGRDFSAFRGSPYVDWQDLVFKNGFVQNHNLSVSGGTENASYFISGGYMDQEGIELSQGFERFSLKANSEIRTGRFTFGESLLLSQTERIIQDEGALFSGNRSARNAPYFQPFGDGQFGYNLSNSTTVGAGGTGTNYLFINDRRLTSVDVRNRKVLGNFYAEMQIIEGLKLRGSLGLDYNVGRGEYLQREADFGGGARQSLLVSSRPIELTLTTAATLRYDKNFGGHNIGALIGFEQTKFRFDKVRIQGRNLFNENFASTGTSVAAANEADLWTLQGLLGRLTYNYKGRYLATFNVRRDATSRFSEENREQVFPSVSFGWRLSEEQFLNGVDFIDDLKLRAGWGQSGNQFSGLNFAYLSSIDNNIRYVVGDGQGTIVAPAPTTFANEALKWETSDQFDIGIDALLLNNRLSITTDYYNKTTNDVLLGLPLPLISGFFLPADANIGQIKNSGIEFSFNYTGKAGEFTYGFGGNLTTVKNEVTDLGPINQIVTGIGGNQTHRTIVGESLGHFYGYKTDGIYQNQEEIDAALPDAGGTPSPGDIRFVDVNGDGQVNADDRTILGSPFPEFFYGFSFNADYKNFDFSINLRGVGDKQIYNSSRIPLEGMTGSNNFSTQVLDRWTADGSTNSSQNPRLAINDPNGNNRISDRWIEDSDYLRIQNIQLGYSFSQTGLAKITNNIVSNLRIYVGAQNLATFTGYTGYDPEVGRAQSFQKGDFTLATGQDDGASPLPRIIQVGLSMTFN